MDTMTSKSTPKSSRILTGSIIVLILICLILGFLTFNIQNKLNALQSNYNQLAIDYSNMQNKLNNLQSSINELNGEILNSNSQERISIARIADVNQSNLTVFAESLSGIDIVIVDATIRDSSGNIVAQNNKQMQPQILPAMKTLVHFDLNFPNADLTFGNQYTVTLITEKGTSFTSTSFTRTSYAPTPSPQPSTLPFYGP